MTGPVRPGDVIDGVYVIERLLGQGGMGAVFVAREERLGRRVALKVLLDAVAKNTEAVKRFEREARSAAALQSDHVTRVLSVGQLPSGAPYIAMELLEGEDLANLLHARRRLEYAEVISYITQVCEALAEAHALGIVHRDLKPANIFLARRPTGTTTVKVLDFGISKAATGTASRALTATSAVMGTPLYMSPEQLREAKNVDGRADIWALGIIMYELIAGQPPFVSDSLPDLCLSIQMATPAPLRTHRATVPPALEAIVHRCLEKDAALRFATVQELGAALSRVGPLQAPAFVVAPPTGGDVDARARAQADTRAVGAAVTAAAIAPPPAVAAPAVAAPAAAGRPQLHLPMAPGSVGMTAVPPQRPAPAATVDPVSLTGQPWMPPKRSGALGVGLVFLAALGIGGAVFYALARSSSEPGPVASTAASASSSAASASAATRAPDAPVTTPNDRKPVLLPIATATSTAATAPIAPRPPTAPAPALVASQPPATVAPSSVSGTIPPPSPPPVVAPSTTTRPASTKPASEPASLMPAQRN